MKLSKLLAATVAACTLSAMAEDVKVETVAVETAPAQAIEEAKPEAPKFDAEAFFAKQPAIFATIGTEPLVTIENVKELLMPQIRMAMEQGMPINEAQVGMAIYPFVQNIVAQKVLAKAALENGLTPDVDAAKAMVDDAKKNYGEEQFEEMLKMQGVNLDKVLKEIAEAKMIEKYRETLDKDIAAVSDDDCKKFYDENQDMFKYRQDVFKASHILVKFPNEGAEPTEEEDKATLAKIEEIKKQLDDGADFAELASQVSDCPSKAQGGDLGEFPEGSMVQPFEEALKALNAGEISGPVKTNFGYHLIKAGERIEAGTIRPFDTVKDNLKNYLENQSKQDFFQKTIEDLKKKYDVKLLIDAPKMPVGF